MDTNKVFRKLKEVARDLDKKLPEYERSMTEKQQFSAVAAHNTLINLRREVKELKKTYQSDLDNLKVLSDSISEISSLSETFIQKLQEGVSDSEQYLQQYGYVPSAKVSKSSSQHEAQSSNGVEEADKTDEIASQIKKEPSTPEQTKAPRNTNRTPQLEDFGLSEETLKTYNTNTFVKKDKPGDSQKNYSNSQPSGIPSPFQHNGFLCTPSLFPSHNDKIMSEGHASLASPVNPKFILEDDSDNTDTVNPMKLGFECESPKSPVLMTPGLKEILTSSKKITHEVVKAHLDQKKASVSLFSKENKQNPYSYEDDEPQEPELTYNLEALQEMTGMFKFNPKEPAPSNAFVSLSDNKENTTPTEPELLSERVAKVNKEAAANPNSSVKPRTLYGEMPESPKLLMNYDFMRK